jgi:hypothetical protein
MIKIDFRGDPVHPELIPNTMSITCKCGFNETYSIPYDLYITMFNLLHHNLIDVDRLKQFFIDFDRFSPNFVLIIPNIGNVLQDYQFMLKHSYCINTSRHALS